MNQVINNFKFGNQRIRVVEIGNEPWWVAKDVLTVLGYDVNGGIAKYITFVPEEWKKGGIPISTPGGIQNAVCISEQGLYFFLARSDKPAALPFQKWIAGEVIPSIRKSGSYQAIKPQSEDEIILIAMRTLLLRVEEMKPKAEAYDEFMSADNVQSMNEVGKLFGLGRTTLFRKLRKSGILMQNNTPYQEYAHHFKVIAKPKAHGGSIVNHLVPLVKPSGIELIRRTILKFDGAVQLPLKYNGQ